MEQRADFILLLNNDTVVDECFLEHLLSTAAQWPDSGILCPRIVHLTNPRKPWYVGGVFSLWSGIPVQAGWWRSADCGEAPREADYATGCAMLIKPAVVRAIGSFDSDFFAYCEDLDFSLRAREAGFKIVFVPASLVYHGVDNHARHVFDTIYYSTRNLLEVMRRHAAWYQWATFGLNFLVRWLGFFTVLACVRRKPQFIQAVAMGAIDFLRGKFGEKAWSATP